MDVQTLMESKTKATAYLNSQTFSGRSGANEREPGAFAPWPQCPLLHRRPWCAFQFWRGGSPVTCSTMVRSSVRFRVPLDEQGNSSLQLQHGVSSMYVTAA